MSQAGVKCGGVQAVLFDLDGTLIDSAPDLAGAANRLRATHGLADMPFQQLRPLVGSGARGMVGATMGVGPDDPRFIALRDEFLAIYEQDMLLHTQVFAGMVPVLARLEAMKLPWGIVTNKAERFALPVVAGLALHDRAAVLVCGDTTPHAKPHPGSLLEAARRMGLRASNCAYVGDDLRDVQAGKAAGMATLAAAWGYLGQGERIDDWGADAVIDLPADLLKWLDSA
ncbi:MAG: HAD-IA family hydrolase [Vitreoscilla sp.]|nr:HAD-IA family hydrolase [Burkholderiales bacterium]MBP6336493.1 HAD-IA family hydrolase [Vitreoscilla sp.]